MCANGSTSTGNIPNTVESQNSKKWIVIYLAILNNFWWATYFLKTGENLEKS